MGNLADSKMLPQRRASGVSPEHCCVDVALASKGVVPAVKADHIRHSTPPPSPVPYQRTMSPRVKYLCICTLAVLAVVALLVCPTVMRFFCNHEGYYPQWAAMRRHLSDLTNPAVVRIRSELFFYDLQMDYVVSYSGLFHVLGWNLWRQYCFGPLCPNAALFESTETNHGLSQWYFLPYVRGNPKYRNPTKWNFLSLQSKPFPKEMVQGSADLLRENAAAVKKEYLENVVSELTMHPDQRTEIDKGGSWDWNFLYGTTGKNEEVCQRVPLTTAVVNQLPTTYNYGFAFFSRLKPGTHIKPHTGSTNLRIRLHLGLVIPDEPDYTATIRVGTEHQAWVQDEVLVFDDAFEHEVVYEGKTERAVFIVDIWHPDLSEQEKELLSWGGFGPFGTVGKSIRKLD